MAKVKAPEFKKPKALKGLSGLGRKHKQPPLPDLDSGPERVASLVNDELANLSRALGDDEKLAKKLLKLKQKFPDGTMPELVVMEWLDRRGIKYEFQKWLLGGRVLRGGQVVDFALDLGTSTLILEVQGNYWHTRPGKVQLDEAQKFALLGLSVFGQKVSRVVAVWESRLMDKHKRNHTMEMALAGVELGK
jgi:hypothetical protein